MPREGGDAGEVDDAGVPGAEDADFVAEGVSE
jgi:hypothetical protein